MMNHRNGLLTVALFLIQVAFPVLALGLTKDDFYCLDFVNPETLNSPSSLDRPIFYSTKVKDCGNGNQQTELNVCSVTAMCTIMTPEQKKIKGYRERTAYFRKSLSDAQANNKSVFGVDWFPTTLTCKGKPASENGGLAPSCPVPEKCRQGDVAFQYTIAGYDIDQLKEKLKQQEDPKANFFLPKDPLEDSNSQEP